MFLIHLDEVSTGVIKYCDGYGSHFRGLLAKHHTQLFQSFVLFLNIFNSKCRQGDSLLEESFLKGPSRRVSIWFESQLDIGWTFGRDNRQPFEFPYWKLGFLDKAQDLRIEPKRLVLVVHYHAGEFDFHKSPLLACSNGKDPQAFRRVRAEL